MPKPIHALAAASLLLAGTIADHAALASPVVSRLTPPSVLFSTGDDSAPVTARFLPRQRFDLQCTVRPDAGQTIDSVTFNVDDLDVGGDVSSTPATVAGLPAGTTIFTRRRYATRVTGDHRLTVIVRQRDGQVVTATTKFSVQPLVAGGEKARNVIILIGDGMGIAHRTAARIVGHGVLQGKAQSRLAMDTFPHTGLVMTSSLNSIVTDSAPGAACYSTGNKCNNNQQGVFPDDTVDAFDNPRVETMGEYLGRTQGKSLGIVTTADVFDATPGAFGSHTSNRGAGSGICDGYLDEMVNRANLTVLMGGGRKWFLPATTPGSGRTAALDSLLPEELATAWFVPRGGLDPNRDLLADFQGAGFSYVANNGQLQAVNVDGTDRLLGLFSLSNMNVTKDKIDARRLDPTARNGEGGAYIVENYGFPDQPMLDEMTDKALRVLDHNPNGFTVMIEGASIDKQAHNMDSDRWILETLEFDRAISVAKEFARRTPGTLVIVTADHECAGINIIGASTVTNAVLKQRAASGVGAGSATVSGLRDGLVGTYDLAGFPRYQILPDGYPATMDIDGKMLIGYAANSDRYEDWATNPRPLQDSQQPFVKVSPLSTYPPDPTKRDVAGNFLVTGQVPGETAVHTASDVPLSAFGTGAAAFTGVMDNTDVFFRAMQTVLGGAVSPEGGN